MEFNPPFIDVTYHREEYVYKELDNGLLEKHVIRKRPGTVGIGAACNTSTMLMLFRIFCGALPKRTPRTF